MKILLISANRERVPYPVLPIGLCYVASALENAGHEVQIEDLCFARDTKRAVQTAIAQHQPSLIGFGLRNMDNCDFYRTKDFLPEAAELIRACRAVSSSPVLLGGSAFSIMPQEIFELLQPDFGIAGDGELAAVALANAIERGTEYGDIPGLLFRDGGEICVRPPLPSPNLDEISPPRIYRWVDVRPYLKYEGVYPLQSKRGCALKCVYCTYVAIEGSRYRFRSGETIAEEVADVYRHSGVRHFEFVDSTFNAPPHHAMEICTALQRRRLPVRFIGNGMNPVATSPELLRQMKLAGFDSLVATAESASDAVLKNLRKGFDRSHLEKVASASRDSGLPTLWIFLLGGPGETEETVRETIDFFREKTGPRDVGFVTAGLRIYPQTALEETARSEGVIASRRDLLQPRFYFSRKLDRTWLRSFLIEAARKDPRLMTSERSQSPLVPFALRTLSFIGVEKPFWRFVPAFNRLMRWAV